MGAHFTDDGYRMEFQDVGGYALFTPRGQVFGWAATWQEAEEKIARERRELIWTERPHLGLAIGEKLIA